MAGWLQAIGQSQLTNNVNQTANTAINMKQLQDQSQHMRALEANQAAELESQNRYRDVQIAEQTMKNDQMKKDIESKQRPIDITVTPQFLGLPQDHQPKVLEFFRTNGLVNERGVGTMESITRGIQMIESSDKLFKSYMLPVVEGKKAAVTQAYNAFLEAKVSGDPKKMAAAQSAYDKTYNDYQSASGNFEKHHETLLKGRQSIEEAHAKAEDKPLVVPEGGAIIDKSTGKVKFKNPKTFKPGEGGGGSQKVYAGVWKATLDDGKVVDLQKTKSGQFIDVYGNPAPQNIVAITQAVGTKPARERGKLSGSPAPAAQSSQPAAPSSSQPTWKKWNY